MRRFKHSYRPAAVLASLLLFTACTTPSQTRQLPHKPLDIPLSAELDSTPFYPQQDYQCGPAALATVINYYQEQTTPEQLVPLVYVPELKGSLQAEMLAAGKRSGRLAIEQDGRLVSILQEIAAGNPVLVMQNLGLTIYPFWHYAVAIGYNLQNQEIILRSGESKRLVRPFSVFERTWQRAKFWSVVMVPIGSIPVTATEQTYSKAAIELEKFTAPESLVKVYQAGLARWPRSFILQMGLGNAAYAEADYAQAEDAFLSATQADPTKPQAWNNLAYALVKQNKKQAALEAIDEALDVAPGQPEYFKSKREISGYK